MTQEVEGRFLGLWGKGLYYTGVGGTGYLLEEMSRKSGRNRARVVPNGYILWETMAKEE